MPVYSVPFTLTLANKTGYQGTILYYCHCDEHDD